MCETVGIPIFHMHSKYKIEFINKIQKRLKITNDIKEIL